MSTFDELAKFRSSTEYRNRTMSIVKALKAFNFRSFYIDDKNMMEYIYNVAYIRGRCAGIEPISFDDAVTIAGNIVPAISTTNSIIESLMIQALRNGCNYYCVDNKKVISKLETCERNPGCPTCSHDWYGTLYRNNLTFGELIRCLKKCGLELSVYSDNNRFFTPDMKESIGKDIKFGYDTVGDAICANQLGRKARVNLYFLNMEMTMSCN